MKFQESVFFKDKFWKLLNFIESHQGQTFPTAYIENNLGILPTEMTDFLFFIGLFPIDIEVERKREELNLKIGHIETIKFEMNFTEWLALQGHFPLIEGFNGKPFNTILKEKLRLIEEENANTSLFDIFSLEEKLKKSRRKNPENLVSKIESIKEKKIFAFLNLTDGKKVELYPHKLVHIDGSLNIVGEDLSDGCLIHISLGLIQSVSEFEKSQFSPKYSVHEINDFVQAIRSVSGSEERLVLKIRDQISQEFETGYHFMGDPYITSNMEGEMIWAASVEISDDLFEWLYQLGDSVEILDPTTVKEQYEIYLEEKIDHLKKAS